MSDDYEQLKDRLIKLSDEQLIEIVLAAPGEYRQDALDIAKTELKWRKVEIPEREEEADEAEEVADLDSKGAPADQFPVVRSRVPGAGCPNCGGALRPGTLVGEKELTVIFSDNQEERFVKVNACSKCGQVSLVVDFETDVQS
jgi:hypothetical protein